MQKDVEKRRAQRRKKIRRRRIRAAFIFFIAIALVTLLIMCFTVFFPIKRISVSGSKIYKNAEIIRASGLTTDDNLFVVSEDKIEKNIRKSLPFIDSVELKRRLPNAVILTVTDAKEFACYKVGDKYLVVSEKGYVLSKCDQPPENVFQIVANDVSGDVSELIKYENDAQRKLSDRLISSLQNNKINIDSIDVTNNIEIKVNVEDRFEVKLGTAENLEAKIAHLSAMIDSIGERSGVIDLSIWTPQNREGSFSENKN